MRLLLSILAVGGCTTLFAYDAEVTNRLAGQWNAPEWCIADGIPHQINFTTMLASSKECGLPAIECVTSDERGIIIHMPDPAFLTERQYLDIRNHAECHVYQIYHFNDFSHKVFY
jgi:hypothetical protein